MESLFDPGSYRFGLAGLPFLVAALAFLAMSVYVGLMRGAPLLRASFLGICASILIFELGSAAMATTGDLAVARTAFRIGLGTTTLAAGFVMLFDMVLARRLAQHWKLAVAGLGAAIASTIACAATPLVVADMWITPSGIPFGTPGPLAVVHIAIIGACVFAGSAVLWRAIDGESSPLRRRQLRGAMWAFSICALGVIDLLLMYRIGWYPTSWLFLTIGAVIAFRSLISDDLLRTAEFDRRAPAAIAYALVAIAAAWWLVGRTTDPIALSVGIVGGFLLLRAGLGVTGFLSRAARAVDTPLERALERYTSTVKEARTIEEISRATEELVGLALGAERISLLVPAREDWSWQRANGELLIETATPDPRLLTWLVDNARPIARDQLVAARLGELREPLERLFDTHEAEVIVPLSSDDEILGLLCLSALPAGRALRPDERVLLDRVQQRAAASIVYANMVRDTHAQVEVAKEVELAAAVQEAFVPGADVAELGRLRITGTYAPASRCGGDWWSTHQLDDGRVLVLIGDVTGHGVAAAMVTAAAKGCYDVALRLMGGDLDLLALMDYLHGAVRRTGGSEFHMTCFATLIDPDAQTLTFANAGHVVPYLIRSGPDGSTSLDVLVARGNPLGAAEQTAVYRQHTKPVRAGDVLVWYTDGIVESTDPRGQQYGDRRFQRALRRIAAGELDVDAIRDQLVHEATAFQSGHAPDDDITLVVGKLATSGG